MTSFTVSGTSLLPVLAEDAPIMALCAHCPEPGHCCKGFQYGSVDGDPYTFWKNSWREDAKRFIERSHLPFEPMEIAREWTDDATGRVYVSILYECPKLGADGRCTIYAQRPFACRRYAPGTSKLCVMEGSELVRIMQGKRLSVEASSQVAA